MHDHREEEQLDAPQVDPVEEAPDGSRIAARKTTIISTITSRFVTEIWKKCQCT